VDGFIATETVVVELLLVVSLVALGVRRLRRLRLPYTVALVIAGLMITASQPLQLRVTPELILALLVPPLVFEAALQISFDSLRRDLAGILLLAVPGVILSTLIVGLLVSRLAPLALPLAMVFGALISATDPVSVVALFRALGAPRRLALLVEGESLLNDGTAIVTFSIVLAAALTGSLNLVQGALDFLRVAAGGAAVGFALGWVTARVIGQVDDHLIETTLTTVLAFGSYLLAEYFHVSGVLAVVVAGLVAGNLGPLGMSPTTRIVLFNFWEYAAFLANSLVFLLIGLQIDIPTLLGSWQAVLAAIVAVLVARALTVYGLGWATRWLPEPIPLRWQHVQNWGGLRGAIGLALALSLPAALGPGVETVRVMAYGVVLFSLLVQSTTMGPLLHRLKIVAPDPAQIEYQTRHARLVAFRAAATHLERMQRDGLISAHAWELVRPELVERAGDLGVKVRELLQGNPAMADAELADARRELGRAQRSALLGLRRDGVISDEVYATLIAEVDSGLSDHTEELDESGVEG